MGPVNKKERPDKTTNQGQDRVDRRVSDIKRSRVFRSLHERPIFVPGYECFGPKAGIYGEVDSSREAYHALTGGVDAERLSFIKQIYESLAPKYRSHLHSTRKPKNAESGMEIQLQNLFEEYKTRRASLSAELTKAFFEAWRDGASIERICERFSARISELEAELLRNTRQVLAGKSAEEGKPQARSEVSDQIAYSILFHTLTPSIVSEEWPPSLPSSQTMSPSDLAKIFSPLKLLRTVFDSNGIGQVLVPKRRPKKDDNPDLASRIRMILGDDLDSSSRDIIVQNILARQNEIGKDGKTFGDLVGECAAEHLATVNRYHEQQDNNPLLNNMDLIVAVRLLQSHLKYIERANSVMNSLQKMGRSESNGMRRVKEGVLLHEIRMQHIVNSIPNSSLGLELSAGKTIGELVEQVKDATKSDSVKAAIRKKLKQVDQ